MVSDILGSTEFGDTYRNLSQKHLMGYHWAMTFCPNSTYVLKADDDAFIDIDQLFEYVNRTYTLEDHNSGILLCNVFPQGTKPSRDPQSKWFVSPEEYEPSTYPKYCGGLAYLITPNLIRRLYHEAAASGAKYFWVDDVFVTGILRELAKVDPFYLNLRYNYDAHKHRAWLREPMVRKAPFMVTHVERGHKFADEMRDLWNKCELFWGETRKHM